MRADARIADLVTAGLDTLAVRVPAHPLAQQLIQECGRPIAAPSANPSGKVSPTTAPHVLEGLSGRIGAVLDGGPCNMGLESTILGFREGGPVLLRPGGVPAEEIARVSGGLLHSSDDQRITAPGQLASHYAPGAALHLNAEPSDGALFLGFGPGEADLNLSPTGDLREAAANLFAHLRALDKVANGRPIAVAPVPETGLGAAINDRLIRAAAPR
jgi:L-threonylcarbamoyladenylate synthase